MTKLVVGTRREACRVHAKNLVHLGREANRTKDVETSSLRHKAQSIYCVNDVAATCIASDDIDEVDHANFGVNGIPFITDCMTMMGIAEVDLHAQSIWLRDPYGLLLTNSADVCE